MIQITIFCGDCKQQVSAVVLPNKGNAVANHLQAALASIHASQCYMENTNDREEGGTDPGAPEAEQGPDADDPQTITH